MVACCARMVPLRGAGGVGDSLLAPRVGHGGFGAGGGRCMSSRISARSACSVSLSPLAPLLRLPLSAHPPVSPPPVTRFFFPHSPHPSPLLPQAVSASPGLSSISHLSHDPFSRPATRWFRPRAEACSYAASVKCGRFCSWPHLRFCVLPQAGALIWRRFRSKSSVCYVCPYSGSFGLKPRENGYARSVENF